MNKKISPYSILCISTLLLCFSLKSAAQTDTLPLYRGAYLGVDIYGIGAHLLGGDTKSGELQLDINLRNRYYPIIEAGYADTKSTSDRGIHYTGEGYYGRIGLNYRVKHRTPGESHLYVGARYAISSFTYSLGNIPMEDHLWNTPPINPNMQDDLWGGSLPVQINQQHATAHWAEFIFGLRAEIWQNLQMGWSIRYKQRLSNGGHPHAEPIHIPGFGANKKNVFGLTYSLIYKLPL